ncbi:hypothetical protein ID866_9232, partial [Astraeus odoratus]
SRTLVSLWVTLLALVTLAASSPAPVAAPEPVPEPIDSSLASVVASNLNLACINGCEAASSAQQLDTNAAITASAASPIHLLGVTAIVGSALADQEDAIYYSAHMHGSMIPVLRTLLKHPLAIMAPPDASIHPAATGKAAETVAQHQNSQELVFYSGWFCPYNQRVWIALEERGIPYQYKEVNPYQKEEHFLEINPKGLVPAIEYKGRALYESLILLEFLEDAYPSHKPSLLPSDPYERGYQRIWIDHISKVILPAWMRLLMTRSDEPEKRDATRKELYDAQRKLLSEVKGPYFSGDQFTLVDVVIAPWVLRDYILAEHRGYKRQDLGDRWVKYAKALSSRECVLKTNSEADKLQVIYDRYLHGEAQSEAAKAIKAGRPLP